MTLSKLTPSGHYQHLAIRTEAGGVEHWLLTDGEIERIRERARKNPHLFIPVIAQGFLARWRAWLMS